MNAIIGESEIGDCPQLDIYRMSTPSEERLIRRRLPLRTLAIEPLYCCAEQDLSLTYIGTMKVYQCPA